MKILVIIICAAVAACVASVLALVFGLKKRKFSDMDKVLINEFSRCNVMVFGKKGTGKDVLFAHVIALRGEKHYANIPYDKNTEVITLDEINVGDNTYEDFINGTVRPVPARFKERCDIYISDGGVYLPAQYHGLLEKKYPSMPAFFALSRQLYDLNIHINSQALQRPWDKLREQADSYIQILGNYIRKDCMYLRIKIYSDYDEAKAQKNEVLSGTVRVPLSELWFNTRYFRDVCLIRELSAYEKIMEMASR